MSRHPKDHVSTDPVYLSAGTRLKFEALERKIGCKAGTLSQAFAPIAVDEALTCHGRLASIEQRVDRAQAAGYLSMAVGTLCVMTGLSLRTLPFDQSFNADQAVALNLFLAMGAAITIFTTNGFQRMQAYQSQILAEEISTLRARLPEHTLE